MKNLDKELLRQLSLISYNRNLILSEQKIPAQQITKKEVTPSDRLGLQGDYQSSISPKKPDFLKKEKEKYNDDKQVAISAYNKIVYEIEGGWSPWKWGTDEQGMSDAILSIKNFQQYQILRDLLAKKYKESAYPNTLLGFIQDQEFSLGENESTRELYNNSSFDITTIGQEYQYRTNDKFLKQMETHLQKFNPDEKFSRVGFMNRTAASIVLPPAASEAVHLILPALSVVTMMFPPASIALEILDAGLYYEEGDKYSAGLGFLFAFIPGGQFAIASRTFSKAEKIALMKKVQKDAAGELTEKYTVKEERLLKLLGDDGVQKMIRKEVTKKAIIKTLDEINSITLLHKVIWWMVKNSYLPARFLTQMGITIGGTFYTWDYIASVLEICNPMGLTKLTKEEEGYLKMIGGVAEFLQQFSTSCEKVRAIQDVKDSIFILQKDIKEMVLKRLQNIIDGNLNLTEKRFGSTYSIETISIQLALRNLGFTKFTEIKKSYTDIKMYEPLKDELPGLSDYEIKKQQSYDPSGGIGASRMATGLPATGNKKMDKEEYSKMIKTPKEERKIVDVTFKWGYYDYNTSMVVKEFQKKNNLTVDGEVGPNTAKKLVEKVKGLSVINPFDSKINKLSKEDMLKIEEEVVKKIKSENENPLTESDLNVRPDSSAIKQVKDDIDKNLTDEISRKGPEMWNLNIVEDEYDSEHPNKQ
jgi:hypothetical protein